MQCELCGIESSGCTFAIVDNVRMLLCTRCLQHGKAEKTSVSEIPVDVRKSLLGRAKKTRIKDIYEKMNRELISGWPDLVKKARVKKKLSREELGFKIGERTITIAKIENGDLRPSDKTIEKLEKVLSVSLFETVQPVSITSESSTSGRLTLGDFIKQEKK